MLHCHVGSQGNFNFIIIEVKYLVNSLLGCDFSLMTSGIRRVVDLALKVNSITGEKRIKAIDIGGGLPVNFASDQVLPTFTQYSNALKKAGNYNNIYFVYF